MQPQCQTLRRQMKPILQKLSHLDGELEEPDDDGLKWEDKENDRCFDAPYCGQKMKVLYQNGWFIGDIDYFNNDFLMYRVSFSDGSDDYMDLPDDIDGVEVILL